MARYHLQTGSILFLCEQGQLFEMPRGNASDIDAVLEKPHPHLDDGQSSKTAVFICSESNCRSSHKRQPLLHYHYYFIPGFVTHVHEDFKLFGSQLIQSPLPGREKS